MTNQGKIRAIVADDSALTRRVLSRMLESDPHIEVVALAQDGVDAIDKARSLQPDIITLDVSMPRENGISALKTIVSEKICPVIMVSSLTRKSAETTLEALSIGAFDCIAKPNGSSINSLDTIQDDLIQKVRAAVANEKRQRLKSHLDIIPSHTQRTSFRTPSHPLLANRATPRKAIAIGISTGGPTSIQSVIPLLPPDLDAAVFLVQHMPINFTNSFARRLNCKCAVTVEEATHDQYVEAGTCYVGQGGTHLVPVRLSSSRVKITCPNEPHTAFMPSVDEMLRAVTKAFGAENTIGVLMTGIGHDGAEALLELKLAGGYTIAESEETAVVYGMPRSAIERGAACDILPKHLIAEAVVHNLAKESVR